MGPSGFQSESDAADLCIQRSLVDSLVIGQMVLAIGTFSVWWILQGTRSVPARSGPDAAHT